MANGKILKDYSVRGAEKALIAHDFEFKGAGDNAQVWEHPPYQEGEKPLQVTIRIRGELDVNSRGRLERTLKEIERRDAEVMANASAPPLVRRPVGLQEEYAMTMNGGLTTLADKNPPYFSLSFPEDTDAVILGNAAALAQTSGPVRHMLAKAAPELQVTRENGAVHLLLPEIGIKSAALDPKDPDYLYHFTDTADALMRTANCVKKAKEHFHIAFSDEGSKLRISQPDLGIDHVLAKNSRNYARQFSEDLAKELEKADAETQGRLALLEALGKVELDGRQLDYHLVQAEGLKTATARRILDLEQGMNILYYGDSVIPRQTIADLERKIRLQNFRTGRGVNAHLKDAGLEGTFAARFAGSSARTGHAPDL